MSDFWDYLGGTVVHPRTTFEQLIDDPQHLLHGLIAVLVIGLLYTGTVAGLAAVGAQITAPAWLAIPKDRYYHWEIFFALPVTALVWILAAGFAHLISKPFGGGATFEQMLAVFGFAIAVPMFVIWIPETIGTVLMHAGIMTQHEWIGLTRHSTFWRLFSVGYQLVAVAWYLVLFPIAVKVAQQLSWGAGVVVGTLTFALAAFLMFVAIR